MARLDWRPVAAPDFSPVAQSYGTAARLLDGAFNGLDNALTGFDRSRDQAVAEEVMARALAIQDPTKYTQALPELAAAAGSRLTPELIASLQAGIGVRGENAAGDLRRQTMKSDLDYNTTIRTDDLQERAAMNAARPILNAITAAEAAKDWTKADQLRRDNQGILGALSTSDFRSSIKTGQEIAAGAQGLEQGALNLDRGRWSLTNDKLDREQSREADRVLDQLVRTSIDTAGAEATLNRMDIDPIVRNAVRSRLGSTFKVDDYLASAAAGGGATGGGNAGAFDIVLGNGKFGQPPKPVSTMTIGEVIDFGRNTLIPNTRGNAQLGLKPGEGSSAQGAFQITQGTADLYGKKLFGEGYKNIVFSPEVQDKIAEAIFNDHKGDATELSKQWASLTVQEAEQVRRMPWSEARQIIAQGEVGMRLPPVLGSPEMTRANTMAASEGRAIGTERSSGRDFSMASGYVAAQQNAGMPLEQVLNTYTGEGGLLAGKDKGQLRTEVNTLSRRYQVSPAVAAWAIAESQKNEATVGSVVSRLATGKGAWNPQRTNLGDASYWIEWAKNGAGADSVNLATQQSQLMQQLPALQANRDAAKAAYDQAVRASVRAGGNVDLRPYQARLNDAEAQLRLANVSAVGSPVVRQSQQPARTPAAIARTMIPAPRPVRSTPGNQSGIDRILNFRMPG